MFDLSAALAGLRPSSRGDTHDADSTCISGKAYRCFMRFFGPAMGGWWEGKGRAGHEQANVSDQSRGYRNVLGSNAHVFSFSACRFHMHTVSHSIARACLACTARCSLRPFPLRASSASLFPPSLPPWYARQERNFHRLFPWTAPSPPLLTALAQLVIAVSLRICSPCLVF